MSNLIYLPTWIRIINKIVDNNKELTHENNYLVKIGYDLNITYTNIYKVVKELQKKDYVVINKKGRKGFIVLTSIGMSRYNHNYREENK